jgi:Phospholipase_D-nuclease N-terminal/Protein of unknown function (DUF1418)
LEYFGLVVLALDIIAIVDAAKGSGDMGKKILWIVLILLLPLVGMILILPARSIQVWRLTPRLSRW